MKIFNVGLFAIFVIFNWSCKKTLDETPYSFYSPNNLYKTEVDAQSAVTGLYGLLHSWYFFKAPYLFSEDADHDQIVGPVWNFSSQGAGAYDQYWGVASLWQGYYNMIAQTNTILERIPAIDFAQDSVKNRLLGEAHFFRGWSFFSLTKLWGSIPLRLENVSGTGVKDLARSSVKDIYSQVVKDLRAADSLLPQKGDRLVGPLGSVTKGAADAMLAKVFLTMGSASLKNATITVRGGSDNGFYTYTKDVVAGYQNMDSKAMYQQAIVWAQKVINSGKYALMDTYMGIWGRANKNNKEMIWELQTQDNTNYGTYLQYWYSAPYYGGTMYMWMSNNLYNDFQQQDDRALNGVFHQYYYSGAWMLYPERDSLLYKNAPNGNMAKFYLTLSHPFTKKYWIGTSTEIGIAATSTNGGLRDVNFPFLRYADVLLMYAEAANEVDGPTADAYAALNAVRVRAKESDTSGLTQQQFRSLVLEERGKEFFQENNRRSDLIRWGVFLQVMNQVGTLENVIKTRSNKNLLFPIPQSELNANKLIGGNNPGW